MQVHGNTLPHARASGPFRCRPPMTAVVRLVGGYFGGQNGRDISAWFLPRAVTATGMPCVVELTETNTVRHKSPFLESGI